MTKILFITESDYETYARAATLADLKGTSTTRLTKAERAAEEEIYSYLSERYDMDLVFPTIYVWTAAQDFSIDERSVVISSGEEPVFYIAKSANTNLPPADNENTWEEDDPRNPMIVRYMVVMSLYQVYQSLHGKNIPQHIREEYDLAKDWLLRVAKGQLNPKLPKLDENNDGLEDLPVVGGGGLSRQDYEFGSNTSATDYNTETRSS